MQKIAKSCRTQFETCTVFVASKLNLGILSIVCVCAMQFCLRIFYRFHRKLGVRHKDMLIKITTCSIANIRKCGTFYSSCYAKQRNFFSVWCFFFADIFNRLHSIFILLRYLVHLFSACVRLKFLFVAFRKLKRIKMREVIGAVRLALNDVFFLVAP